MNFPQIRSMAFRSMLATLACAACADQASAGRLIADNEAKDPAEELKAFHLPPGFEVQLVASEPDIHKPINIAFDDRGRLWVTDTVEYPFPAAEARHARHGEDPGRLRRRRQGPQDHHLRRQPEHPHRRAALRGE